MKRKSLLVLAIVLMAVGFASVSTTLYLNGNTNVASNADDFDVYFSKVLENGVEKNTLIQDKQHIVFTANLSEVGEEYKLKYEVTNASKNYDVSVTLNVPAGNEYVSVTNKFDTSNLLARTSREGTLTLTVIKGVTEEMTFPIEITLEVSAVERTEINVGDITGENYIDSTLNGTDPVLKEGLIPVTIADNGAVTYANTHTKWYDYENKEWANAVILSEGVTHEVGDAIPESDIESYFVWIPKYKYQIFDMGNYNGDTTRESKAQEIQIEFTLDETNDSDTSCISPKIAGESGTCSVGKWMTHPAFQNFDVTGLWVGKFETGYKGATSKSDAQKNEINDINDNKIIIKPNVYSWRYNTVGNFFKSFYNYKRELDSHMMKNTEWGAVAILSHSRYGINDEVRINNNSNYLTGYGASEKDASGSTKNNQAYNTETGYKASSTGNITGIYDLSGGAWEYVAGYSGVGSSGLAETELTTYSKYFDVYPSDSTSTTYNKRILGDAVGEMGPFSGYQNSWYADGSNFVDSDGPWFIRGGYYANGVYAGQFNFHRGTGVAFSGYGARLVLAVK